MMKRKAVVDYGIDYGLHNMQGTAGLYYVSNPVSCIIIYDAGLVPRPRDGTELIPRALNVEVKSS